MVRKIVVPDDYGSIKEAVEAAKAGEKTEIILRAGVYHSKNVDVTDKDIEITDESEEE